MDEGTYHGTTIIAFVITKGVILASNSRKTDSKEIVKNKDKKILNCDQFLSGVAGWTKDCKTCRRLLKRKNKERKEMGEKLSMATAAREVRDFIYGLPGDIEEDKPDCLIAGIEDWVGKIYKVNADGTISPSTTMEGIGSGHRHALQILEKGYKEDITVKKAIALAQRALTWAIIRDWMTGGEIQVFYLGNNGTVHQESFETEMNLDIGEAKTARKALMEKFDNGEFDVDNLISEVQYVDD